MALNILSWDLPEPAVMTEYLKMARETWIPRITHQPGFQEFRAYRNPHKTSPQVCVHTEWDSMAALMAYVESADYEATVEEMRDIGCTNITAEVWTSSPVVPRPIRP